jgi:hypothetical protein
MIFDAKNDQRGTDGRDLMVVGPQHKPFLICLPFVARNLFKSPPSIFYKVKLQRACTLVIKPSQFRKFKLFLETAFPLLKLESLSFYFQASGTWNYVPVPRKTIYFTLVISL